MSESTDPEDHCNATIDLGARGIHLCYLHRGHTGSHRHSEMLAAMAEASALLPPKWDGNLKGGKWVPKRLYDELRDDRDRAREVIAMLLSDAAHTDWGDCEPWDSIVEAERYLDRK